MNRKNASTSPALLSVDSLTIGVRYLDRSFFPVRNVSFSIHSSRTLGVVGDSGSGKTLTALSILGLLPQNAQQIGGLIKFQGTPLNQPGGFRFDEVRGRQIAFIFQEPAAALNPLIGIGVQIRDVIRKHLHLNKPAARSRAIELLEKVDLPDPVRLYRAYPHQLSGGMAQRAMIAMALSCNPQLIIADEPTTALDLATQARIFDRLDKLQKEQQFALLLITHDVKLVAQRADEILVMQNGEVVEWGGTTAVFHDPRHASTRRLLQAVRPLRQVPELREAEPIYHFPETGT